MSSVFSSEESELAVSRKIIHIFEVRHQFFLPNIMILENVDAQISRIEHLVKNAAPPVFVGSFHWTADPTDPRNHNLFFGFCRP